MKAPIPHRATMLVLLVALLGVLTFDGLAIAFHNGATAVTVNEAVQRYRQSVANQAATANQAGVTAAGATATGATQPAGTQTGTSQGTPSGRQAASATTVPRSNSRAGSPITVAAGSPPAATTTTTATVPESPMPGTGVYVYDTSGYERLDTPGSRRNFPAQTTITVTSNGPGCQAIRWQPFKQHWEQYDLCFRGNGEVTLTSTASYVSFYNVANQSSMNCPPPSNYWRPPTQPVTKTWAYKCVDSSDQYQTDGTLVGLDSLNVAGDTVAAVHIHLDLTISGKDQGQSQEDMWLAASNSLLLRLTGTADATESTGSLGNVQYQEKFDLELTHLQPRR